MKRPLLLGYLTLVAFAANSILNRLAMLHADNEALSFAIVRLTTGALALSPLLLRGLKQRPLVSSARDLLSPLWLAAYAVGFSLAYRRLDAGSGALLLFGSVQLSMLALALARGQRLSALEALGFGLAAAGLVYLLLPSATQPPLGAALSMAAAGAAWGLYSSAGLGQSDPAFNTARNFALAAPLGLALLLWHPLTLGPSGWALATVSGALASALGYVLWYRVLRDIRASTAAIIQLSVPILAGGGGALLLGEWPNPRWWAAGALVLGGIWIKTRRA